MFTLFIWSTASLDGSAQGCVDFYDRDSAISTYRFMCDLAMQGRDKITCITLEDTASEEYQTLYTATFPE